MEDIPPMNNIFQDKKYSRDGKKKRGTMMTVMVMIMQRGGVGVRIKLAKMMRRCEMWELARG